MKAAGAVVTALVCTLMLLSLVLFARGLEHARGPQQVTVVVVPTEALPPGAAGSASDAP